MELFPFHLRTKGIVLFSWFSRASVFFGQLVSPIGLHNAGKCRASGAPVAKLIDKLRLSKWKCYIRWGIPIDSRRNSIFSNSYCVCVAFQVVFIYFMFHAGRARFL